MTVVFELEPAAEPLAAQLALRRRRGDRGVNSVAGGDNAQHTDDKQEDKSHCVVFGLECGTDHWKMGMYAKIAAGFCVGGRDWFFN